MKRKRSVHPIRLSIVLSALVILYGCASDAPKATSSHTTQASSIKNAAFTDIGTKDPIVVLQAGHQDDKSSWNKLLPELAKHHRVIALDRAGHGGNPATASPRDPCTIAREQRAMLQAAGAKPPYILVGHSLGGLYQYTYAKLFPKEVAGLVLLDPTHPKHWETMQRDYKQGAALIKIMRSAVFSDIDRREFDSQADCLSTEIDTSSPVTVPVKLLVSGRFRPEENATYQKMVGTLRKDWARILGVPNPTTVWDSGHYIQKESPQEVVLAVDSAISESGKK